MPYICNLFFVVEYLSSKVSVSAKIDTPTILRILKGAFNNSSGKITFFKYNNYLKIIK